MIPYHKSVFGMGLLFRVHGSAAYRACLTGFIGVILLWLIHEFWESMGFEKPDELRHPYSIGVLVGTVTFLLIFRTQQGYSRYWEACSAVHHMMSKWMDAVTHTAIYHLQCAHYDDIKPPSYFHYPELNAYYLTRSREHGDPSQELERIGERAAAKSIEKLQESKGPLASTGRSSRKLFNMSVDEDVGIPKPITLEGPPRLDGNWGKLFDDGKATFFDPKNPDHRPKGFADLTGGRTPPLFLQELAHLSSLMNAVALSTLRNDVEGSESPLDVFIPGADWPEVDPGNVEALAFELPLWRRALSFLGMGRSPADRTRHNASRPLGVIGGISDAEIQFLQMARGPSAKTQLCWQWTSEFIIREHLNGTTGKVGPPIISRIIQFLGDGMIYYNHARKIMFIPFPFPHAQLSALYVLIAVPAVAFLMDQYTQDLWVGSVLTFFTVTALSGIHEVARELENPFRNVPNEVPLCTLQAMFNEALLTMYAGYHPDHFWAESVEDIKAGKNKPAEAAGPLSRAPPPATPTTPSTPAKPSVSEEIAELKKIIEAQGKEIANLRQTTQVANVVDEKKTAEGQAPLSSWIMSSSANTTPGYVDKWIRVQSSPEK